MPIDRNSAQYITGALYKPTQTSAPGVWDLDDQANSIAKNLWPLPPQAIQRSLRFDGTSYFTRTFVAASRTTWTWSAWIKVCAFDTYRGLFVRGDSYIYFNANNKIEINLRNAATNYFLLATPVYRDPTAWYHIVVALDTNNGTAADRLKLYINNVRVQQYDISTYQNISTGYEPLINSAAIHGLGAADNAASFFPGYMAEVNFISGQALDATSFGETDQQTGVWIPKRYTGTYGTNGFRLSFANNSSTTALGYDSSGAGNNWTANNFSITPGVGNDVFVDVPSLYGTDTGLGGQVLGNYATFNPLVTQRLSLSDGNLKTNWVTSWGIALGSIAVNSGMWYFESYPDAGQWHMTGVDQPKSIHSSHVGANSTTKGIAIVYDPSNTRGDISYNGGNSVYTGGSTTFNSGDVIGVALDLDNNNVKFYKNNILQYNLSNLLEAGAYYTFGVSMFNGGNIYGNFGQRPFTYPAPSGYKALCTTNLPAPAIGQTSSNQADNHFNVVTYTGNGGTQTISTLDFQPDLVWIKRRDSNWSHAVYDSIRGAGSLKALSTNSADAEGVFNADTTYGYLSSFNNNGFTVLNGSTGGYTNLNNATYVAWCWNAGGTTATNTSGTITSQVRANRAAGFSIVTYTGTGANATVGHGLGITPSMIILKNRFSSAQGWTIWFTGFTANEYLILNSTASKYTFAGQWSALPTATTIGLSSEVWTNGSGNSMVGYCWAAIPGYSAFGSYTGNGSSDGPFVYLGFRPRWLLVKNITFSPTNWILHDSARALTNPDGNLLLPDQSGAEAINSSVDYIDFLANGFKVRGNGEAQNRSGSTHIYAAFAETPARLSTAR